MNTKLHAICDSQGRPLDLFVTAGQVSDYIGARALLSNLPNVDWLLGDRGYDADWFREALKDKGIRACIPGRKQRKRLIKYDKRRYKRRNRIEIMFGRLKDWRRVATRYDRCPKVFLSAIALAAHRHLLAMSPDPRVWKMSDDQTIAIDGKDYKIDDLSDAVKAQLENIWFCDQQIQQLQSEWAVADTARIGYSNALKVELERAKA